ncbi:putative membrane-bound dehydrogenase domain-containing protein [Cyclobacterium xiamenense]|uniref:Putative membrane-bound dehydrogenase domain-containing protein n=1 Tax=Cyclobacterium xiamenense TaxID=1297121 RepID=A0A1H6UTX5_9BACT|nr:PVC-type heme-binding CxxCH protein [Cyclobacterium xiamenense]SEI93137.1 putative membrane-bound dehydrogenase domain-containing protein [Cyclobacterium xiamenense]
MKHCGLIAIAILFWMGCGNKSTEISLSDGPRRAEILFLGHESTHHNSEKLMPMLARHLFQKGINLTYTADPEDLNAENLRLYDGLMIYANHDEITADQEKALKNYVEGGKALIPIHSASFCFRNSDWFVETVGGQFSSHGTGDFTATIVDATHPVMEGIEEFETWDETYVHAQLNEDMTVLMERVDGEHREPYTWVREQGKGRIFYTAYGHDERTWSQPQFQDLVANGVLWAIGDNVAAQVAAYDIPQPVFEDAEIPNYENRDPAPRYQLPLSPEESMKLVQVPVGFELQLFASEPDIINPMAMCWDEKGRLYVIETTDYPNEVRKEGGNDKIKMLEDTDGDGKADKVTIFADGLNIPTSLVAVNGGILISMAPDFVFLKDTDGDGKADVKETLITGWGKSDTHAGPSNLRYGFDNKLWGVLGYSGFRGEVDGTSFSFGQGVYRFDPDGTDFEFLGNTSNNTWGLGFSEEFNVFISTANGQHSAYLAMPREYVRRPVHGGSVNAVHGIDSHYDMPHLTPFLRQVDWHGGYTAAAGHHLYTARNFPKSYWNRVAFVAEPTGRVLHNAIIEKEGSGFREKNGFNILASSDEWFSPVHAEVGPDGALWIADWYNFIIQHNPTPKGFENGEGNAYINPLRDAKHGRIYRMVYKGSDSYEVMNIDSDRNADLIAGLKSDNMFWRMTAQRLIVENQKTDLIPELLKLVDDPSVDEIGLNSPAVHALWALHGIGALDGSNQSVNEVVARALKHPAAGVRKNALQVLPRNSASLEAVLATDVLKDPDLNTRKTAFLALADMPSSETASNLLLTSADAADNGADPYLPQAIFASVLSHPQSFENLSASLLDPNKPDSLLSLRERVSKSLVSEQYSLDRRAGIPYPPEVVGKELHLQATLSKADEPLEGIIVAQGNSTNGYSLYIQNNRINWLVRQDGKSYQVSSGTGLPAQQFVLNASLLQDGAMVLSIDDRQVGTAKAAGLFDQELEPNRVRIGHDNMGSDQVGTYPDRFYFRGRMNSRASHLNLKIPAENTGTSGSMASSESSTQGTAGAVTIKMGVIQHEMKFDKPSFTVKAGQQVTIDFANDDFMQHNLLIGKAGSLETIGKAADELARDPNGVTMNFVPKIPEVLASTPLVNPETSESLVFTAPNEPGEYPYLCTVPGHWRIMNGIMIVE